MAKNKKILIKNGNVVSLEEKKIEKKDILIKDGKIEEVGSNIPPKSEYKIINAAEKLVSPGFFDLHVHLREPGREDEETLETGTLTALSGGFTRICCMPNTDPPLDTKENIEYIVRRSKLINRAEIFPIGTVTKGRKGEELAEIGLLVEGGAVGISDNGDWILNSFIMKNALEYTKMYKIPVISHAEDPFFSKEGFINEGRVSTNLGIPGIPRTAEITAIARDIELAKYTQGKLHITHLSTKEGVEFIRRAKKEGLNVTADVTPHHLLFTEDVLYEFDTNFKVSPPLRTQNDREALLEGLKEGIIDAIATDHAPHGSEEKEQEFIKAPSGIIGLQTVFSVLYENLVENRKLDLLELISSLTKKPYEIIFNSFPRITPGEECNLVIIDLNKEWIFNEKTNYSKSKNSPFFGKKLKAKIERVLFKDREFEF